MISIPDLRKFYNEEEKSVEIPTINIYNSDYIRNQIKILKNNPIRNRFYVTNKTYFAVKMTGLDNLTAEPKNVTECYLLGELCLNRHPQFYTKPIKILNYIIFDDEAIISGARNYIKNQRVEIEIMYRINNTYKRQWFLIEKI
jgi:hypothetical protein